MKVFFSGIGGIGMSALARYFAHTGAEISGSDTTKTVVTDDIASEGISVSLCQTGDNIASSTDLLIYSEAIPADHPERLYAEKHAILQQSYFEALGEISKHKQSVAICGTHGKSTTTAMAGLAFEHANADPLVVVGTRIFEWGMRNIRLPKKKKRQGLFLTESCEYKESFLHLHPQIMVVTNIEADHLDYFGSEDNYFRAFHRLAKKLPPEGILIANFDQPHIAEIFADISVQKKNTAHFREVIPPLLLHGEHYQENAACVLALADALHISLTDVSDGLEQFRGTWRRFERKGEKNGISVIDDYAHHPTEIQTTLAALREEYPSQKIWAVFQPHQYSRTRHFLEGFSTSFQNADVVLVPSIYEVRDTAEDITSVSAEMLVKKISHHHSDARYTHDFNRTADILRTQMQSGDILITLGAGPVDEVADLFLDEKEVCA